MPLSLERFIAESSGHSDEPASPRFDRVNIWGIHNDSLTTELVDEGFISIGWDDQPDLRGIRDGRQGLKRALAEQHPDAKPGSIAARAGVLLRFRDEMSVGDVVVAPYKPDSTINLGVISSDYYFEPGAPTHRHRRRVDWIKTGLPRTVFSQPALFEIGSVLTVFRVRRHVDEFMTALRSEDDSIDEITRAVDAAADRSSEDDAAGDEPRASRIDRHTRDFVLEALHRRRSRFNVSTIRGPSQRPRCSNSLGLRGRGSCRSS